MGEIKYIFTKLHPTPDTPMQELEDEAARLRSQVGQLETKQLAIKKFINSVYGAMGSKYFIAYNTNMAESITAQGRDLNHYSENCVNDYFEGIFQSNPAITLYYQWSYLRSDGTHITFEDEEKPEDYYNKGQWIECKPWSPAVKKGKKLTKDDVACLKDNSTGHFDWFQTQTTLFKKLGITEEQGRNFIIDAGRTTQIPKLTGEEYDYLTNKDRVSMTIAGDTDSVSGDTIIYWGFAGSAEQSTTIEEMFNIIKEQNMDTVLNLENGSEVVPTSELTAIRTYCPILNHVTQKPVKYVMRHKVKKARYRITTSSGKQVIVTGDHSCMVLRDGKLTAVKANEIDPKTDKMITDNHYKPTVTEESNEG